MGIVQIDPSKSGLSKRIKADSLELKDTPEGMGEVGNYSGAKNQTGLEKHLFLVHAFHTCRLMSYLNILFCSPTQEISIFFYIKKTVNIRILSGKHLSFISSPCLLQSGVIMIVWWLKE